MSKQIKDHRYESYRKELQDDLANIEAGRAKLFSLESLDRDIDQLISKYENTGDGHSKSSPLVN